MSGRSEQWIDVGRKAVLDEMHAIYEQAFDRGLTRPFEPFRAREFGVSLERHYWDVAAAVAQSAWGDGVAEANRRAADCRRMAASPWAPPSPPESQP